HGAFARSAHQFPVQPSLHWSVVSGPGTVTFDDPSLPHPVVLPSAQGVYVFRLSATHNGETRTDDVTVTLTPHNKAPWADAGANIFVRSTADPVQLHGTVRDDGLPLGTPLKVKWRKQFGPGTVGFGNESNAVTTATFSADGIYVLELSADDTEFVSLDTMEVRVGAICTVPPPTGIAAWWQANAETADHISG